MGKAEIAEEARLTAAQLMDELDDAVEQTVDELARLHPALDEIAVTQLATRAWICKKLAWQELLIKKLTKLAVSRA